MARSSKFSEFNRQGSVQHGYAVTVRNSRCLLIHWLLLPSLRSELWWRHRVAGSDGGQQSTDWGDQDGHLCQSCTSDADEEAQMDSIHVCQAQSRLFLGYDAHHPVPSPGLAPAATVPENAVPTTDRPGWQEQGLKSPYGHTLSLGKAGDPSPYHSIAPPCSWTGLTSKTAMPLVLRDLKTQPLHQRDPIGNHTINRGHSSSRSCKPATREAIGPSQLRQVSERFTLFQRDASAAAPSSRCTGPAPTPVRCCHRAPELRPRPDSSPIPCSSRYCG